MSSHRELAENYFYLIGHGRVDAAMDLFSPTPDFTTPMGRVEDLAGVRMMMNGHGTSFPGHRFEIAIAFESGEHLATEGIWHGTHTGPMMLPTGASIPATGKTVAVPFATLFRIRGGRIHAHHAYWDLAGFMDQLGLGPRV